MPKRILTLVMLTFAGVLVALPMDAGAGTRSHRGQAGIHRTHHQVLAGYGHHGYGYGSRYSYGHGYRSGYGYGYGHGYAYGHGYGYGRGYGYGGYDYPRYGDLKIKVKPDEARVYVNGAEAGVVDDFNGWWQSLSLDPGKYLIEIELDGYRTYRKRIYVVAGKTYTIRHKMRLATPSDPGVDGDPQETHDGAEGEAVAEKEGGKV